MKTPSIPDKEIRVSVGQVELRAADGDDKKPMVRGYAAVFNKESDNLGSSRSQFREIIEPGAFSSVLADDVRALLNHDPNFILARSKGGQGSLRIWQDDTGLGYEFDAPDTQAGRDLMESLKRGDIDQSSFSFTVEKDGQRWEERQEGDGPTMVTRWISKVARLFDVSPVTYPAYPDASVALRSLEQFQAEQPPANPKPETLPTPSQEDPSIAHWQRAMDLIDKPAANKQ